METVYNDEDVSVGCFELDDCAFWESDPGCNITIYLTNRGHWIYQWWGSHTEYHLATEAKAVELMNTYGIEAPVDKLKQDTIL